MDEPIGVALRRVAWRLSGWPRWVLVGVLVLAAAGSALSARGVRAAAGATRAVAVAAHDLPSGRVLRAGDLRVVRWPAALVPSGAVPGPDVMVGRTLTGPLARGEPVTSARLRGPGVTVGLAAGSVAATVSLSSAASAEFIRAGDHVDLLRAPPDDASSGDASSGDASSGDASSGDASTDGTGSTSRSTAATVVVADVTVLAVSRSDDLASLLVAVTRAQAVQLADIPGSVLATLRPPN